MLLRTDHSKVYHAYTGMVSGVMTVYTKVIQADSEDLMLKLAKAISAAAAKRCKEEQGGPPCCFRRNHFGCAKRLGLRLSLLPPVSEAAGPSR